MNIDNVYICDIYRLVGKMYNKIDINTSTRNNSNYCVDNYGMVNKYELVKLALVYYSVLQGGFIDMETGQYYSLGFPSNIGELFVDVHKSKIYGKTLMGSDRKHYSRKRIIKKYNEVKGDIGECK